MQCSQRWGDHSTHDGSRQHDRGHLPRKSENSAQHLFSLAQAAAGCNGQAPGGGGQRKPLDPATHLGDENRGV